MSDDSDSRKILYEMALRNESNQKTADDPDLKRFDAEARKQLFLQQRKNQIAFERNYMTKEEIAKAERIKMTANGSFNTILDGIATNNEEKVSDGTESLVKLLQSSSDIPVSLLQYIQTAYETIQERYSSPEYTTLFKEIIQPALEPLLKVKLADKLHVGDTLGLNKDIIRALKNSASDFDALNPIGHGVQVLKSMLFGGDEDLFEQYMGMKSDPALIERLVEEIPEMVSRFETARPYDDSTKDFLTRELREYYVPDTEIRRLYVRDPVHFSNLRRRFFKENAIRAFKRVFPHDEAPVIKPDDSASAPVEPPAGADDASEASGFSDLADISGALDVSSSSSSSSGDQAQSTQSRSRQPRQSMPPSAFASASSGLPPRPTSRIPVSIARRPITRSQSVGQGKTAKGNTAKATKESKAIIKEAKNVLSKDQVKQLAELLKVS